MRVRPAIALVKYLPTLRPMPFHSRVLSSIKRLAISITCKILLGSANLHIVSGPAAKDQLCFAYTTIPVTVPD